MRPLIMGPDGKRTLRAVREHAEANPVDRAEILRRFECREPVADPLAMCVIPFDFRVAFTIEEHPGGWMRHLSVSVPEPGRLPNLEAMRWIGRELGMQIELSAGVPCKVYLEGPEDGPPVAVNVIEPMDRTG